MQCADGDAVLLGKVEIGNGGIGNQLDAMCLEIPLQRQDHAVVLVVTAAGHSFQRFNARKFKNHPVHVAPEFEEAAPGLEREGGLPHMPEVGFKEMGRLSEPVRDGHVVELFLRGDEETAKGEPFLLGEAHAAHIEDAAVLIDQTGARMGGVRGVKSKNFFGYAASGQLEGGNGGKKLPEIFIGFLVEHPAPAAEEAMLCVSASVICAAEKVEALEHMNVLSFEAAVTHEISRGCERAEPRRPTI